jgi:hypothetical protein
MTADFSPRLFAADADVVHIGEGLLARTLPRPEWTHEAHLAACLYLLTQRPDIDIDAEIATIITRYNESVGGVNDDTQGYHDTITRAYVAGVRLFLRGWRGGGRAGRARQRAAAEPDGTARLGAGLLQPRVALFGPGAAWVRAARSRAVALTAGG